MRHAQLVLIPPEHCPPCPLVEECVEKHTDAACTSVAQENAIHPANWSVFEQRFAWAPYPVGTRESVTLPTLPAYFTRVPQLAGNVIAEVPSGAVCISLRDFMLLTNKGANVREVLKVGERTFVVIGADPDRVCDRYWRQWPEVRKRLVAQPPDLVVPPDLAFYQRDLPAVRLLNSNAHSIMYVNLVERGIPCVPPFGWVYPSDVERFFAWADEFKVPGAFLDLQRRTPASSFDGVVEDLRSFRHRIPDGFLWLVNGVQIPERMRVLHKILGNVRFTSAGPWQHARGQRVFLPETLKVEKTTLSATDAFAQSVLAITAAAEASRPRVKPVRHRSRQMHLGLTHANPTQSLSR